MLFKSSILTQASGSVGGLTYSHNRGGMYIRARAIPTDPSSSLQLQRRAAVASASSAWRELSTAVRASWELYAKEVTLTNALGDPITLSGQQHYVRYATAFRLVNNDNPTTAPTNTTLGEPPVLTPGAIEATAGNPDVNVDLTSSGPWVEDPNARLLVQLGVQQGPGVTYNPRRYRFAANVPGNATTPPTDVNASYLNTWATALTAGNKIWLRFRVLYTGQSVLSEATVVGPVTVAA